MELTSIPGIGDKTVDVLKKASINTISELLSTYPRTYRTYHTTTTQNLEIGQWVVLMGTIKKPVSHRSAQISTQSSTFWDASGMVTLRWFNMPYIVRSVDPTATYIVKGQVSHFAGRHQIISPQLTKTEDRNALRETIVPIYSGRGGIKPWIIRQKIAQTLDHIGTTLLDPLHPEIRNKFNLIPYKEALLGIHLPSSKEELELSIRRLSFQELYEIQLANLKSDERGKKRPQLTIDRSKVDQFLATLPFSPTVSQISAIKDVITDMGKNVAMNRLIQGEVGSGKTIVAVAAAIAAQSAGVRTLLMAPTQILALQLYDNFCKFCEPLGITVSLLTAKSKENNATDVVCGTQALLYGKAQKNIGLVIIDEQHRFGVDQRELWAQFDPLPHFLEMTATPIPRSMAQTLFHHLDMTRLTDVPQNRLPTKTYVVPEFKRQDSYDWIKREVESNHNQAFIVVPLIEAAEENDATPLKSLKELEGKLKSEFAGLTVDIMHGKMTEKDKLEHMTAFKQGSTHILVATSMIEVGIDVPEANIIVIEDAERFGLAQLHQLRGRVGRGGKQGYCLLFTAAKSPKAQARLAFFVRENNGEELARYDLEHRGPGELFGTLQSGFFNLALGSMYDEQLLTDTYQAAKMTLLMDKC